MTEWARRPEEKISFGGEEKEAAASSRRSLSGIAVREEADRVEQWERTPREG